MNCCKKRIRKDKHHRIISSYFSKISFFSVPSYVMMCNKVSHFRCMHQIPSSIQNRFLWGLSWILMHKSQIFISHSCHLLARKVEQLCHWKMQRLLHQIM
ncbi:hypothetical protein CDL12_16344 [Handroanthus impetiginosus]|uniref:Uncharacterized protein n=1 Tax=Handroanthus impetiginosus TaxID=429701 RepID=A0A2G9H0L0_9LAMI|nr:hypothetical protein CDL12_16344 [Handroanthus impetiginosus]